MPEQGPPRRYGDGVAWGFAVLGGVIALIILGWGFGGNGRGWGENNELAHMMPPASGYSTDGPATRAWSPRPSSAH